MTIELESKAVALSKRIREATNILVQLQRDIDEFNLEAFKQRRTDEKI